MYASSDSVLVICLQNVADLKEFKAKIETIYKPLIGKTFDGCVYERKSPPVGIEGGPEIA